MSKIPNTLWRDRKRVFGLPLTFTKYSLTEDRLFVETGFFNLHSEETLLYRVRDISLSLSLGQRLFGVGSVVIDSSDKTAPRIVLKNVRNPRQVKEQLHTQVEEMKIARRMRLGEILDHSDDDGDEEGFFDLE